MSVKIHSAKEKQTLELVISVDNETEGHQKTVVVRFENEKLEKAEMSFDGLNWVSLLEAKTVLDAFVEKYPNFAVEE